MKKNKELIKGCLVFGFYLLPFFLSIIATRYFIDDAHTFKIIARIAIALEFFIPIVLLIIFRKLLINDFKSLKTDYQRIIRTALKYWFIGLFVMMLFNGILSLITSGEIAANEELNRELINTNLIFALISILIYAPITEELVFRAAFKKAFRHVINFALFSGLLFAGLHVVSAFVDANSFREAIANWKQLLFILPYISLGIAFAYAYYETDNIFASMIVHFIHNFLVVSIILLSSLLGLL